MLSTFYAYVEYVSVRRFAFDVCSCFEIGEKRNFYRKTLNFK